MINKMEIVEPKEIDGIEFYCSLDGEKRGVSQRGCAKLCGIDEKTLRRLLTSLSVRTNPPLIGLEHLQGIDLYLGITSSQHAKVLDEKVVATLVSYYAFEKSNEIAKFSLQKFATIGIGTWIKQIVGYDHHETTAMLLENINSTMGKMMVKLEKLELIEEETLGYRKATVSLPVLEKWMNELSEEAKAKVLAPSVEMFTVKEAVEILYPGMVMNKTVFKKLSLKCSQTIDALSNQPTPTKNTLNSKGYNMLVKAYTREQLPLIKLCLGAIMQE